MDQENACSASGYACLFEEYKTSTLGIVAILLDYVLSLCACLFARLDAVEDLIAHPTFENEFNEIAKGLPDLERIVSRIHAKNCKIKDFLKVLGVSTVIPLSQFANN